MKKQGGKVRGPGEETPPVKLKKKPKKKKKCSKKPERVLDPCKTGAGRRGGNREDNRGEPQALLPKTCQNSGGERNERGKKGVGSVFPVLKSTKPKNE